MHFPLKVNKASDIHLDVSRTGGVNIEYVSPAFKYPFIPSPVPGELPASCDSFTFLFSGGGQQHRIRDLGDSFSISQREMNPLCNIYVYNS